MIVAIDGPAGAGKSTVAKQLAERLGYEYVDTGAMYRALTWLAMARGVPLAEGDRLARLAEDFPVLLADGRVVIAGTDVTASIRQTRVDRMVPVVARHPEVRTVMRSRQRELAEAGDTVVEGRDIGTVVAPDAPVKIFLTASPEERARRRAAELGADIDTVLRDQTLRDAQDEGRAHSPLQMAPGALALDTTGMSLDEVVQHIAGLVHEAS